MNVEIEHIELENSILKFSNQIASVCHQLCYNICFNNNIKKSSLVTKKISEKDLLEAIRLYLDDKKDTFAKIYERTCSLKQGKNILHEIVENDDEYFDYKIDINGKALNEIVVFERENVFLQLTKTEYGEMLIQNPDSKLFTFSNHFFKAYLKMQFAFEKENIRTRKAGEKIKFFDVMDADLLFTNYIKYLDVKWSDDKVIQYLQNENTSEKVIENWRINKQEIRKGNINVKNNTKHNYYKKR
jgi:hypothetical protein